jgi:deferrochelatase/peroxidase EfeB
MLASLQSNIIHPHVRLHLRVLALRLHAPDAARRGLAEIGRGMKSAMQQLEELREFRASGRPGSAYTGVALSCSGYAALGIERARWPSDPAFLDGLQRRDLGDPERAAWEPSYQDGLDVLLTIGSHDAALTEAEVRRVRGILGESARVLAEETGCTLTNAHGDGIEHFGYVDGRSQPLFIDEELALERETGGGADRWNPLVPLSHVLVPDPGAPGCGHAFGSYLVYRKLEQNVRLFKQQEARIAGELGLRGDDAERVGALLIGRFEDGTPITLAPSAGMHPVPNDFTYGDDRDGARCPYGAHIRRVNSRVGDPSERVVIARRGQGYGVRADDPDDGDIERKPTGGVGLLFLAAVARLEQFEALQRAANGDDGGPYDPVMGQRRIGRDQPRAELASSWGDARAQRRSVELEPVVRMLGGEYCFLPSVDFLTGLDDR